MVRGKARMRWGERLEFVAEAGPGDFIYVPPFVPHQEINASPSEPLECVLVRSDNEAVVVNLDIEPVEKPDKSVGRSDPQGVTRFAIAACRRQPQQRFDHGLGMATPLPAMSCALPCATEENRIGLPMVSAAVAFGARSFAAMWPWSCSMTMKASTPAHVKHGVGAERAGHRDALRRGRIDRRLDDVDLLAAEQAAFAGMRIEAADRDLRRRRCPCA